MTFCHKNINTKEMFLISNYIAIPKGIILNKEIGNERVTIYSYLYGRINNINKFYFTTTNFCEFVGLKPNYRGNRINSRFYQGLKKLSDLGYLEDIGFEEMSKEQKNSKELRIANVNTDKFVINNDTYCYIRFDEINKISNFKTILKDKPVDTVRISPYYVLLVLAYIRLYIHNKKDDLPNTCFRYYETISEDLGISEQYVAKSVNILSNLKIISYIRMQPSLKEYNGEIIKRDGIKIFANTYRYIKDNNGEIILDDTYNPISELEKQKKLIIKWRIDKYNKEFLEMEEKI